MDIHKTLKNIYKTGKPRVPSPETNPTGSHINVITGDVGGSYEASRAPRNVPPSIQRKRKNEKGRRRAEDGQPRTRYVTDYKNSDLNTPGNQNRTGSDSECAERSKTCRNPSNFRILYWNPGGITGKICELRNLAELEDIHVFLLGETKLHPQQELRLLNYITYRRDEVSS
ncbi:hypothetical protein EVAR_59756_1 [Eumeta japonica]|uniref:Uncharacterized protein n=1 Tax=Eumeta variegata TaxID=151549 RepID=A0A4C1ZNW5_EUMVA|nr:hypothetical protein EVAR_59756_1 [Eumeta japonica]